MSTVPAADIGKSDAELIDSVRKGNIHAYGSLYERHTAAAYNLARQLAKSPSEADDLVSEAFSKVLDTLRAGKGPDAAFRAYLLTALRHTAYDKTRKDRRIDLNEDMTTVGGSAGEALTLPFSDTAIAGLERTMAAKAFAKLPERWQAVLWHTEIEQQTPAEVAPLLGLTANGVSALAYRAREGLRQAYLQVHLAETTAERCRATADRLGAWTRDGLSKRERIQVETHLDECEQCRALAAELSDINGALRAIVAPLVLGGAVLGYLALSGAKAGAVTVGMAAATTGTAVGVGSAAAGAAAGSAGGSGAGAAAGAASAVPRQLVGVAASGAAVVAAVAVALAAGGTTEIPAAVAQPVVQAPAPAKPAPAPPAPAKPVPPVAPPAAPPAPVVEPPPPPAAPIAEPSKITVASPPQGVELGSNGQPVDLPITIRNDGGTTSEPVVMALNLPRGVKAVSPSGGGGTPINGFAPRADLPSTDPLTVNCPAGEGTVTCKTSVGLQPGQSAVLIYRLVADQNAQPGAVTGSVTAGAEIKVAVSVKVTVKQAEDLLDLRARAVWSWTFPAPYPWAHSSWVNVDVSNTGTTSKPVTITLSRPARLVLGTSQADCASSSGPASCVSLKPLKPGEHLRLWFETTELPPTGITVTATMGSSSKSQNVTLDCPWFCKQPNLPQPSPQLPSVSSTPTPTPSAPATTSTSSPSSEPLAPAVSPTSTTSTPTSTPSPSANTPTTTETPASPTINHGPQNPPNSTNSTTSATTSPISTPSPEPPTQTPPAWWRPPFF